METKEEGRVSAYVSPEAKKMLREMAERWFPGLKRPMGAALDRVIRAEYQRMREEPRWNNESLSSVGLEYERKMGRLGARIEDARDPSGERDPEADI